ncbi:hypothetical protein ACWCWD_29290 [Streptomyces sp. NPDC001493]
MMITKNTRPTTRDVGWGIDDLGWGVAPGRGDIDWGYDFGWGVTGRC